MITLIKAFSFGNLYQSYLMCRCGKREKTTTIKFELQVLENIYKLAFLLQKKKYEIGEYNYFCIYEPKKREIMALTFEHRVVQYCLCKYILEPVIEKHLIYDTYACRLGKGTHKGLYRLDDFLKQHYRKHGLNGYIIKGDISKYFYSIDHDILKNMLYPMIDESIYWLLDQIIDSTKNPGIPLGNQSSQWFANLYLSSFDHWVKEKLRIKYYIRYMDDWIAILPTKEDAHCCLQEMEKYLWEKLKLRTNEKTQIFPIKNGINFLGFNSRLAKTGKVIRKVRQKSKSAMKRKLRKFKCLYVADKIAKENIELSYNSWLGHAKHGHCYRLIQSMDKYYKKVFEGDGIDGNDNS